MPFRPCNPLVTIEMVGFAVPAKIRDRMHTAAPEREGGGPATRSGHRRDEGERIAVLLIDDRALFGESLVAAINAGTPDISAVHRTSEQALADLPSSLKDADVVLVAAGKSSLTSGPVGQTLKRLLDERRHPPIAIVTDRTGSGVVDEATRLKLRGIVASTAPLSAVVGAIRHIHGGGAVMPGQP